MTKYALKINNILKYNNNYSFSDYRPDYPLA